MSPSQGYRIETACRSCGSERLTLILSLGDTPLADLLVSRSDLGQVDMTVPPTATSYRVAAGGVG